MRFSDSAYPHNTQRSQRRRLPILEIDFKSSVKGIDTVEVKPLGPSPGKLCKNFPKSLDQGKSVESSTKADIKKAGIAAEAFANAKGKIHVAQVLCGLLCGSTLKHPLRAKKP